MAGNRASNIAAMTETAMMALTDLFVAFRMFVFIYTTFLRLSSFYCGDYNNKDWNAFTTII